MASAVEPLDRHESPPEPAPTSDGRTSTATAHLLVLENNPFAARALRRLLSAVFDSVTLAADLAEADQAIEGAQTTHLLCTDTLAGSGVGAARVASWRRRFPLIRRVVLLAGDPDELEANAAFDAVFDKLGRPQELRQLLVPE